MPPARWLKEQKHTARKQCITCGNQEGIHWILILYNAERSKGVTSHCIGFGKSLAVALSCPTYKKMNLLAETGSVQYSMEDPAMLRREILRK